MLLEVVFQCEMGRTVTGKTVRVAQRLVHAKQGSASQNLDQDQITNE